MSPSLRGHRHELGTPRARFHMQIPWYLWFICWGLPVVLALIIWWRGSPGGAIALIIILAILEAIPLTWFMRRHQIVLTETSFVYGPFVPRVHPHVVRYQDLDLASIRTWKNIRKYLKSSEQRSSESGMMITEGSTTGVTLRVLRGGEFRDGILTEDFAIERMGGLVEVIAISGSADRFIRTLSAAMVDAGVPQAEHLMQTALPPGRLSGAKGAHLDEIPGFQGDSDMWR
jgi:hypothetical protein